MVLILTPVQTEVYSVCIRCTITYNNNVPWDILEGHMVTEEDIVKNEVASYQVLYHDI